MLSPRVVAAAVVLGGLATGAGFSVLLRDEVAGVARSATGGLQVRNVLEIASRRSASFDPSGPPGRVAFALPPGLGLDGITTAFLYPEAKDRPVLGQAMECQLLQTSGGELDLARWIEVTEPQGDWFLLYAVSASDEASSRCCFVGWERIQAADLCGGSLRIVPRTGNEHVVRVQLADQTRVPGALVSVDLLSFLGGATTTSTLTDSRGEVRFVGLDPRADWTTFLLRGVGPVTKRIESTLLGDGRPTVLHVPVHGAWRFVPLHVEKACPGQTTLIERVCARDGMSRHWLSNDLLLGSRNGIARPYVMCRAGATLPKAMDVWFRGFEPLAARFDGTSYRTSFCEARPRRQVSAEVQPSGRGELGPRGRR